MAISDEAFLKAKQLAREDISPENEAVLAEMCAASSAELSSRLKDGVSLDYIHDSFVRSAATLGLAMYLELDTTQIQSFSAGSVRVSRRSPEQARSGAQALRSQAELMMIGYLNDPSFGFKAVKS